MYCGEDNNSREKCLVLLNNIYSEAYNLLAKGDVPNYMEIDVISRLQRRIAHENIDPHWKLNTKEREERTEQFIKKNFKCASTSSDIMTLPEKPSECPWHKARLGSRHRLP